MATAPQLRSGEHKSTLGHTDSGLPTCSVVSQAVSPPPDFVRRDFTAEAPDLVWCGDMTEIETGDGKLYSATVIDLFSRRLLGYAMGARHDVELVAAALHMAAATRGGNVRGVIFHTDRGSEPGLNRSSQHRVPGSIADARSGLRLVSSSRGFCGACC